MPQTAARRRERRAELKSADPEAYEKELAKARVRMAAWKARKRATDPAWVERQKEKRLADYLGNREKHDAQNKAWREANRERDGVTRRAAFRAWREQNREAYDTRRRSPEFREATNTRQRPHESARYQNDVQYRLRKILRAHLRYALKAFGGGRKGRSAMDLIGCTLDELRAHIEGQFQAGMTWATVHIDHIRPCASFDLSDPEQQRACFHYTNLRPMWPVDNQRKGAKWSPT